MTTTKIKTWAGVEPCFVEMKIQQLTYLVVPRITELSQVNRKADTQVGQLGQPPQHKFSAELGD